MQYNVLRLDSSSFTTVPSRFDSSDCEETTRHDRDGGDGMDGKRIGSDSWDGRERV